MAAWVHRMAGWVKTRPLVKGVMVIAAIGFSLLFIIVLQPDENLTNILQSFGYLEMIPPSNFHGPGTINTIEAISVNKIKLHPTCEMDGQSLASLTRSSLTVDQTTIQK